MELESNSLNAVQHAPITLAECLVSPIPQNNSSQQQLFIDVITRVSTTDFMEINAAIACKAAEIRSNYNLQLPDAFQIATALEAGCQAFFNQ